jgi:hypothetical protein
MKALFLFLCALCVCVSHGYSQPPAAQIPGSMARRVPMAAVFAWPSTAQEFDIASDGSVHFGSITFIGSLRVVGYARPAGGRQLQSGNARDPYGLQHGGHRPL